MYLVARQANPTTTPTTPTATTKHPSNGIDLATPDEDFGMQRKSLMLAEDESEQEERKTYATYGTKIFGLAMHDPWDHSGDLVQEGRRDMRCGPWVRGFPEGW